MSDGTQETKLLECPFCGGEARLYDYDTATDTWIVICGSCPAVMASRKSPEEAAAWWNRRAALSPVGASVPSEVVAQTIYEALCETQIKLARLKPNIDTQSRLSRINAALAWLAQQRGQG